MSQRIETDFERIQSLGFTLAKARSVVTAEVDAALKDVGVNSHQLGILLALSHDTARSAVQLSKLLGVDPALMTRMLDKLEERGLVERTRNMTDRRTVDLALTPDGRELLTLSMQTVPATPSDRLARFTAPEFEALGNLLGKLLDN